MNFQLHHFFILCKAGAPEADKIIDSGLTEGSGNDHPGQGTANRRFFFANTTLELLYLRNEEEASGGPAAILRFTERSTQKSASPFGIVVYRTDPAIDVFSGTRYCPEYFPPDVCFQIGENAGMLEEPLCICMPADFPAPSNPEPPANTSLALTQLKIGTPATTLSSVLLEVSRCKGIAIKPDSEHHMELTFNSGREGVEHDLTAAIPLVLRW